MKVRYEKKEIDMIHTDEFVTNGCKVRLLFTVEHNPGIRDFVLGNLLRVIERKREEAEISDQVHASVG
jgi:hypothetical protein